MGERAVCGVEVEILPSCVSREVVVMGARAIFERERGGGGKSPCLVC